MTEADWETCEDPLVMVHFITSRRPLTPPSPPLWAIMYRRMTDLRRRPLDRKLRLFACACCRRIWPLLGPAAQALVETSERYADGQARPGELVRAIQLTFHEERAAQPLLRQAVSSRRAARRQRGQARARALAANAARASAHEDGDSAAEMVQQPAAIARALWGRNSGRLRCVADERRFQAALLRDVLGPLPFRQILLDPFWLTRNNEAVRTLAKAVYPSPRPGDLTELANALEDAGCADPLILAHCRGPGPHVRGCFVTDLILNKQ
jgi:hypothetical protein